MRIGILGTRGIPNHYGGFEQFVHHVAPALVKKGHAVFVYQSSLHPYGGELWNGVHLIRKSDPQSFMGTAGQFIYDLNCVLDSRKRAFDVLLQLGYTSSSIWSFLFPERSKTVTSMDGMEWQRGKYGSLVKYFLKKAEALAVASSHHLLSDSKVIQEYLLDAYGRSSSFIAYGADMEMEADLTVISRKGLCAGAYDLLIARMVPENNIEMILAAHTGMNEIPLVVIGDTGNSYGRHLKRKYDSGTILYLGGIFDPAALNGWRKGARIYFHGHSAGGTNPSLLEAMACGVCIAAHDNAFNRSVLDQDGFYFRNEADLVQLLTQPPAEELKSGRIYRNIQKIRQQYNWERIVNSLEDCFLHLMEPGVYGKATT